MAGQFPGGGAGPINNSVNDDAITWLKAIANSISGLSQQFAGLIDRVGTAGTFTFPAAASVVVRNVNIKAGSLIELSPANAAAGTLVGSAKCPYAAQVDFVAGVSFTVKTASAAAAAGTEIFYYRIVNLV